jgi:hypothetical protein
MTRILTLAAFAGLAALGACRSSEPPAAYANPVEACEHKATVAERDECMKNVVADVAISVKREAERKPPR